MQQTTTMRNKVDYKYSNIKTAIVSLSTTLHYNIKGNDLRALDLFYLREYLIRFKGRTCVDFVTLKTYQNKNLQIAKDILKTDINYYDEVIIHNSEYNSLFGGMLQKPYELTLMSLSIFRGAVWYYLLDPRFHCIDYGKFLKKRILDNNITFRIGKITVEDCERYSNNVHPNIKCLFAGLDFNKYKDTKNSKTNVEFKKESLIYWDSIPIHEFWSANMLQYEEI